jgi:hypothetical protein
MLGEIRGSGLNGGKVIKRTLVKQIRRVYY